MIRSEPSIFDVRFSLLEVRMMTPAAAGKRTIEGYAAVFNSRSEVMQTDGGMPFVETIRPGAFAKALQESDVRGLFNHDTRSVLGRRGAGTLRITEDAKGLRYEIDLGTRSYDRDLEESLARKDIVGSSFSFTAFDDDWSGSEGEVAVRELRGVHLFDVGPVTFPAYRSATATCRALTAFAEARSARASTPGVVYPTPEQIKLLNDFAIADFGPLF